LAERHKSCVYSNWLGLMKGDLEEQMDKAARPNVRKLNAGRENSTRWTARA